MAKVFISVPILDRPELRSLHSIYMAMSTASHSFKLYYNENDSLISRVRNVHLSLFYHDYKDYDYFCSIDSDIEIRNIFKDNNMFDKLVAANKDFVGGLYALKKKNMVKCSSVPLKGEDLKFNNGIIEMKWLSTGCWMLTRDMVKRMIEGYPNLEYLGDDNVIGKKCHALYMPMIYKFRPEDNVPPELIGAGKFLSEDWSFSSRWKDLGGKIYADTSILLNHIGKTDYYLFDAIRKDTKQS